MSSANEINISIKRFIFCASSNIPSISNFGFVWSEVKFCPKIMARLDEFILFSGLSTILLRCKKINRIKFKFRFGIRPSFFLISLANLRLSHFDPSAMLKVRQDSTADFSIKGCGNSRRNSFNALVKALTDLHRSIVL